MLWLIFCPVVWLADPVAAQAQGSEKHPPDIVGEARDIESNNLLYREFYTLDERGLPRKVEYRLPDDRLLATKALQFNQSGEPSELTFPSVDHQNLLNGRLMEVQGDGDPITVRYRESQRDPIEEASLPRKPQAVVDAGFDEFVRQNWDRLMSGERLTMNFLMPSRLDYVALQLRHRTLPSDRDEGSNQAIWIQATPANGFLRLFVDPIDLYYQRDSRRLIRYSGISNLMDPSGSSMTVDIRYQYRQ
ncbi:hypothetical protein [Pseudomaricurvus sp.]|uniref:hypothetical protein n=1 Tax=Pseudomaricurvus sp. TaxID=2004510 RepID=UPI003F6CC084